MEGLVKEKRIRTLICEATSKSSSLSNGRANALLEAFEHALSALNTPAVKRNQCALLLSVATRHVKRAERLAIEAMLGKEWISQQEEAVCVRIRLLCAEIIGLLTTASDELRLVPVPIQRDF